MRERVLSFHHILFLAIVQGITEFLPISSSAHLILFSKIFAFQDQGLKIDVAIHMGSLLAVMLYFWRDMSQMTSGSLKLLRGKQSAGGKLFLNLVVATIPVVIAGFLFKEYASSAWRTLVVIGSTSIGFGIVLYLVDQYAPQRSSLKQLTLFKSFFVGVIQAFAIIPGTSRAGASITGLRMLGFNRTESAHFSCPMSIPTIIAAGTLIGYEIYKGGLVSFGQNELTAAGVSFFVCLLSIGFMMRWVSTQSYTIFVVYRVALGMGILAIAFFK